MIPQQIAKLTAPFPPEVLEEIAALEGKIEALTAANAELREALEAIRESVRDNDMFRVGQYVTAALARKP